MGRRYSNSIYRRSKSYSIELIPSHVVEKPAARTWHNGKH